MTTKLTIIELITTAAKNTTTILKGDKVDYQLFMAVLEAQKSVENYESATKSINDRSDGWKYEWDSMHDIVMAQEQLKFWQEVVAASSKSRDEADLEITIEGLTTRLQTVLDSVLNNYDSGSSTSGFSNAASAVKREMHTRLLGHFGSLVGLHS